MPTSADASPALLRPRWFGVGVFVIAILAAYANTLRAPFVYDDVLAIPENPTIRSLWPLTKVLLPQAEGGLTVSGRPVLNLSFALNYAISGRDVWSYHAFNILVHASAALLLFGIVRRTVHQVGTGSRPAVGGAGRAILPSSETTFLALAIASLWALHPLQTQAVTYTVQRAESLMGFFYLLTLYAFVRAMDCHPLDDKRAGEARRHERWWEAWQRRRGWLGMGVAACTLGMATKEVMATAPLLVLLYDRIFVAGSFRAAWRARRGFYLALAATWLVLGALVLSTGGNRGGTVGLGVGLPLWAYPLTQFEALARYLGLSVWPHPLVFEYGTFWVEHPGDLLPHALIVLPLLIATGVALWPRGEARKARWPVAGFLGAWFFLILAPTSLAPGTIQMIVEHRMYLPFAAVVSALVLGLRQIAGSRAIVGLGVGAAALAVLTTLRNHDYRSHLALWTDTVAKRPLNPRAQAGLAEALAAAGRMDEAIEAREKSVRLLPEESTYHYNLALTLAEAGRTEEAVGQYRHALRLHPNEARTHNNLAILLAKLGRQEEALTHYAEAVRLDAANPLFHYNLGVALMRAQRQAEALASYEAAVRARPSDPEYAISYGGALLLAGRPAEALAQFERAQATQPGSLEARFGAGNALAALRRFDEAVEQYRAILRQDPAHVKAHFKLGNALLDLDRVPEAVTHYTAALRHAPDDAEAQHNLGIAFARLERWDDARRAFDAALKLKPDYADARKSREQLRDLTGR